MESGWEIFLHLLMVHVIHDHIISVCNKGSVLAFYCVLGYMHSVEASSFTVAFLARNLGDAFNEIKLLTFSMLLFCSVWISFLPVYHTIKCKSMVAVEVSVSWTLVKDYFFCFLVSRCYIILLRPQKIPFYTFRKPHSETYNITQI